MIIIGKGLFQSYPSDIARAVKVQFIQVAMSLCTLLTTYRLIEIPKNQSLSNYYSSVLISVSEKYASINHNVDVKESHHAQDFGQRNL